MVAIAFTVPPLICWIAVESFRLLVLRTAWLIDRHKDYQKVRKDIAAITVMTPQV